MTIHVDSSGRVAVISGGANGIRLATARRLVAGRATVTLWDIDEQALAKTRAGLSASASVVIDQVDVTDAADVVRAADKVASEFGKIDILVASAAASRPDSWDEHYAASRPQVSTIARAVVARLRVVSQPALAIKAWRLVPQDDPARRGDPVLCGDPPESGAGQRGLLSRLPHRRAGPAHAR